jgi:simple sugar transport system substrate-binding protein
VKVAALTALTSAVLIGCGKKRKSHARQRLRLPWLTARAAEDKAFAYIGRWVTAAGQLRTTTAARRSKPVGDKIVTSFVENVPESADATQ